MELYQKSQLEQQKKSSQKQGTSSPSEDSQEGRTLARSTNKLSYKLKRELEEIPASIEALEIELASLQEDVNAPDFFRREITETKPILTRIEEIENAINQQLERWAYLENLQDN